MIPVEECLYKLDQKLNRLSTFVNQEVPVEDKILALNEAQIECVLTKIDINNIYHLGLDGFRKRYEDLEILIQPHTPLGLTLADKNLNKYVSSPLQDINPKYLLYTDIYILADKLNCKDRVLSVNIEKHSDIRVLLNNKNYCPSFEYQETIGTISSGNLEIYSDGTFTPTQAFVSYLTYPDKMDYEGYITLDGEDSETKNSNLPDYMINEIIAIAVRNLSGSTGNQEAFQTSHVLSQKND